MTTILTAPPSVEAAAEKVERQRKIDAMSILCDAWVESLESGSVSFKRAARAIGDIANVSAKNELVSQGVANRVAGESLRKCVESECDGPQNGRPSGLVRLVKEVSPRLYGKGFTTATSKRSESFFAHQSAVMAEYGCVVSPHCVRDWYYRKIYLKTS